MIVTEVGVWKVHAGTVVGPDGATAVTVIHDGVSEWFTAANPAHLVVALMKHLGIERVGETP